MLPSPTMLNIVKSCCRNGQYALVPKSWYYNSKLLQKCSMSSSACITVSPPACQLDDPVNITISGLKKHKIYTLHTSLTDQKGVPFTSVAHYRSDEHGIIDLDKTPSRGGHFASLYPMGPFISMVQQGPSGQHARIHLTDMYSPLNYQLEVYPDAVGYQLMQKGKSLGLKPICSTQHTRRLMGKGCTSIPVRHGRIRGTLHLPPGDGPFPGVVDMYGSAGGLRELRPAVLAARGFAVLSLAFFGYEDLVPDLTHQLDTAYFQEAVDFVLHHEKVIKNGVGVMGFSKAGDIVLSLGADIPEVKAVISLNGCVSNIFGSMRFKDGSVIEGLYGDNSRILITPEGAGDGTHLVNNPLDYPKTIIPIEKIKCKVLWFTSLDDKNFRGTEMVQIIKQLLRERNPEALEKYWEFMEGPNAGHVIEPPYLPYTSASYHRLVNGVMIWGGSAVDHSIAEVKLWKRIQEVLRQELIPAE